MVSRYFRVLLVLTLTALLAISTWVFDSDTQPAAAQTAATVIDFDPAQFQAGQQLTTIGDVSFKSPVQVFAPSNIQTITPPQALTSVALCSDPSQCPNQGSSIDMGFLRPMETVSFMVGTDSSATENCFPEGPCEVQTRVQAFNSNGDLTYDSGFFTIADFLLRGINDPGFAPITSPISVSDSRTGIVRVLVTTKSHGDVATPTQLDHLSFSSWQSPGTSVPPPQLEITSPTDSTVIPWPYSVEVRGHVNSSSLAALCVRVNGAPAADSDACGFRGQVRPDGQFSVPLGSAVFTRGRGNLITVEARDTSGQRTAKSVTVDLAAQAAPTIQLIQPTNKQVFERIEDVRLTGFVTARGGIAGFCVRYNTPVIPKPEDCKQLDVTGGGEQERGFSLQPKPEDLVQGDNTARLYAFDRNDQVGTAAVTFRTPADARVVAIELSQGIQTTELQTSLDSRVAYSGTKLVRGGRTIVRVFANLQGKPGRVSKMTAVLRGTYRPIGKNYEAPLGLLLPDNGPLAVERGLLEVKPAQRADANGGFVFTLPHSWTVNPEITLSAEVNPKIGGFGGVDRDNPECSQCRSNNIFTMSSVRFTGQDWIQISPVMITWTDTAGNTVSPSADPADVFNRMRWISPIAENGLYVAPYVTTIDVSDLVQNDACDDTCTGKIHARVTAAEIANYPGYTIGVSRGLNIGLEAPETYFRPLLGPSWESIAIVDEGPIPGQMTKPRPLTIVAHEAYHSLGLYHAGTSATPPCPPSNWPNTSWPPDEMGFIQGVGLDRRPGSGPTPGTYRIIYPGQPGNPSTVVDLMSYCLTKTWLPDFGDFNAWISIRNWERFGKVFPNSSPFPGGAVGTGSAGQPTSSGSRLSSTRISGPTMRFTADIRGEQGEFVDIRRTTNSSVMREHASSPFTVVVEKGGRRLYSGSVYAIAGHTPDGSAIVKLTGEVPFGDQIRIMRGNHLVAVAHRSASSPRVRILSSLPRGAKLQRDGELGLRWTTVDRDTNRIVSRVEVSYDDGRTFKPLRSGIVGGRVVLHGREFARSTRVRLRIVASDGFNESSALSKPFVTVGRPPVVRIWSPVKQQAQRTDVPIQLLGEAYDDQLKKLAGSRMRWEVDGHLVGTGQLVESIPVKAGWHIITLAATTSSGLTARTSLRILVHQHGRPLAVKTKPKARVRTVSYRTKAGDTLGRIARRFYGSTGKWRKVYWANRARIEATAHRHGRRSSRGGPQHRLGWFIYAGTALKIPNATRGF